MNTFGRVLDFFVPNFLFKDPKTPREQGFLNYRALWISSMALLAAVSLIPVSLLTYFDYRLSEQILRSEFVLKTLRTTSNARRTVSYFLDERRAALEFTLREESYASLSDPAHLAEVLRNLKTGFGGFTDLGVINKDGLQMAYEGQFDLLGRSYKDQTWFRAALTKGAYVSEVFLGFRDSPHVVIASRSFTPDGDPFILRATLDIKQFVRMLADLELGEGGDAFIINREGVLQTPSDLYGDMLEAAGIDVPPPSERTDHFEAVDSLETTVLVTYAYILDSPFILCVVNPTGEPMRPWREQRWNLLWAFLSSIVAILVVIYVISTFFTNGIHEANHRQAETMERMEQTGRLASIGRLAAGVAHEINNPLAVISERAGLVRDLIHLSEAETDERLVKNIDIVLESVERCGKITKQLLGFARKVDLDVEQLDPEQVTRDVLTFLEKEADYRGIRIDVDFAQDVGQIRSDRGKLQQILLNLVTNAFQAMNDGGSLTITGSRKGSESISLKVTDTGCGIPKANLKHIFEPFFTTKGASDGSGLGLSITYGLVHKLQGTIKVESEPGIGTTFTINLPHEMETYDAPNQHPAG